MNAFKIRIALFELMGDKFTSLIDLDMSCKEHVLLEKLDHLVIEIKNFIQENKNGD